MNKKETSNADCLQRLVRLLAIWNDENAEYRYVLQKYTPPLKPKWLNYIPPMPIIVGWGAVAGYTTDREKIKRWMDHYGIEIEYLDKHKQPNVES